MSATRASRDPANIRGLVGELADPPRIGPAELMVRGGVIQAREDELERLLGVWAGPSLDHLLSLETGDIRLGKVERRSEDGEPWLPADCDDIERLRLFGASGQGAPGPPERGGDLELRRDGARFLWRYIGAHDGEQVEAAVAAGLAGEDFWARPEAPRLRVRVRSMLLWGKRESGAADFFDPRVGWARLTYPNPGEAERMELAYLELCAAGVVELVWWTAVRAHG